MRLLYRLRHRRPSGGLRPTPWRGASRVVFAWEVPFAPSSPAHRKGVREWMAAAANKSCDRVFERHCMPIRCTGSTADASRPPSVHAGDHCGHGPLGSGTGRPGVPCLRHSLTEPSHVSAHRHLGETHRVEPSPRDPDHALLDHRDYEPAVSHVIRSWPGSRRPVRARRLCPVAPSPGDSVPGGRPSGIHGDRHVPLPHQSRRPPAYEEGPHPAGRRRPAPCLLRGTWRQAIPQSGLLPDSPALGRAWLRRFGQGLSGGTCLGPGGPARPSAALSSGEEGE
ncbi:hypothetical protein SHIRM173S_03134 [Streptomyces hirsutus]